MIYTLLQLYNNILDILGTIMYALTLLYNVNDIELYSIVYLLHVYKRLYIKNVHFEN